MPFNPPSLSLAPLAPPPFPALPNPPPPDHPQGGWGLGQVPVKTRRVAFEVKLI